MYLTLYLLALAALAANAPAVLWTPGATSFIVIIGWIGIWRYSWGAVHFLRSLWYRQVAFPRRRRWLGEIEAATDGAEDLLPPEVFIVVTSFRIPAETTATVFTAAIREAATYPGRTTIVASLVEMADQRLVKDLFRRLAPPPQVRLVCILGQGAGKREGLATALRAVSRQAPLPGSVVIVQDGDAVLPDGCLRATLPFFGLQPRLAALTTDEDCIVPDAGPVLRAWHHLRFAQRHLLMSSMALSGRLITMTGRMSAYRVEIATDPGFVAEVEHDTLDHWRHGRIRLLTGEDKSAAYALLRRGAEMLYVPDVRVLTVEHPPAPDLLRTATALMLRWSGNMLRASGRCIELGPGRLGWFVWWCLVDQRISMWTPLIGPIAAVLLAIAVTPAFLYAYLLWVMVSRLAQALLLLAVRPRISGLYPLLIYFGQVYGALVKTWVLFRLDRQRWTRQDIAYVPPRGPWAARLHALGSAYLHLLALGTLVMVVAILAHLLPLPGMAAFAVPS